MATIRNDEMSPSLSVTENKPPMTYLLSQEVSVIWNGPTRKMTTADEENVAFPAENVSFARWMERAIHDVFYQLGLWIVDRATACIIVTLITTLVLAAGVVRFREVNNVRDQFSSVMAPSRQEFAVAREFFREFGDPFTVIVAIRAADGGNLLRPRHLERTLKIEEHLQYGLRVEHDGRRFAYSDFCGAQCETSDAVNIFLTMYKRVHKAVEELTDGGNATTTSRNSVKLTFPTLDVYGHRIYLANNMFQVEVNNRSNQVESVGLITIYFHAIYANASAEAVMRKWEREVLRFAVTSLTEDELVNVYTTSEGLMSAEVKRTSSQTEPLMVATFMTVLIFTVATSLKLDPIKSKPWEACIGCICPLLSIGASFGALFWAGFEFLPIMVVVPFLVLAVGVDDVFIFLHCWARSEATAISLRERVARVLAEAGPSITITSLTNLLSFSIGIFTPTPAIRIFCIYTCVAVFADYVYQIVFYTAIMVLFGRREERQLNAYLPWIRMAPKKKRKEWTSPVNRPPMLANDLCRRLNALASRLLDVWVDALMSVGARTALAGTLLAYWSVAGYGVAQIRVGMASEKLYLADSPLLPLVHFQREIIFKKGGQMAVFVNRPGDLNEPERLASVMDLLKRFEMAHGSVGASSTQMWLTNYLSFIALQQNALEFNFTYKHISQFFSTLEYHRWRHYVNVGDDYACFAERPSCVDRFFFTTGFENAVTWRERLTLLHVWRDIASRFAHLNVTIFDHFSVYSDQLESMPRITLQTMAAALICVGTVLFLFTPHWSIIVPGVCCVLSINLGVFGLFYYWDIDLDPISMTTTLMAIGLSVDFVAHISFHYYKGDFEDRRSRLRHALVSIGWPMIQAGTSTILSLAFLATIPAYMVQVFVKVITLVVSLGLFHGLIVLPIICAAIPFHKHNTAAANTTDATTVSEKVPPRIFITQIKCSIDATPKGVTSTPFPLSMGRYGTGEYPY